MPGVVVHTCFSPVDGETLPRKCKCDQKVSYDEARALVDNGNYKFRDNTRRSIIPVVPVAPDPVVDTDREDTAYWDELLAAQNLGMGRGKAIGKNIVYTGGTADVEDASEKQFRKSLGIASKGHGPEYEGGPEPECESFPAFDPFLADVYSRAAQLKDDCDNVAALVAGITATRNKLVAEVRAWLDSLSPHLQSLIEEDWRQRQIPYTAPPTEIPKLIFTFSCSDCGNKFEREIEPGIIVTEKTTFTCKDCVKVRWRGRNKKPAKEAVLVEEVPTSSLRGPEGGLTASSHSPEVFY